MRKLLLLVAIMMMVVIANAQSCQGGFQCQSGACINGQCSPQNPPLNTKDDCGVSHTVCNANFTCNQGQCCYWLDFWCESPQLQGPPQDSQLPPTVLRSHLNFNGTPPPDVTKTKRSNNETQQKYRCSAVNRCVDRWMRRTQDHHHRFTTGNRLNARTNQL
jgi:hypothetical protein